MAITARNKLDVRSSESNMLQVLRRKYERIFSTNRDKLDVISSESNMLQGPSLVHLLSYWKNSYINNHIKCENKELASEN